MEVKQGIDVRCGHDHKQRIVLQGYTKEWATSYAQLMDGTHPLYITSPREDGASMLARCGICNSLINCTVFGYDDA